MKSYSVKLFPSAQQELLSILDYIAIDLYTPQADSNKLNLSFESAFNRLASFTLSGKTLSCQFPLQHDFRWISVENYMVFYTVNELEESVNILHIRFASLDYLQILT